jgi:uncharacterized protein involved in exopolysaccharide biosynthesis
MPVWMARKDARLLNENRYSSSEDLDMDAITAPLRARWKLIVLGVVLGGAIAFGVSNMLPKTYQSSATIYVQQDSLMSGMLRQLPIQIGSGQAGDQSGYMMSLLQSDTILDRVATSLKLASNRDFTHGDQLEYDLFIKRLKDSVSVKQDKNGGILLSVDASKPALASDIANSMLDNLGRMVVNSSQRKADFVAARLDDTSADLHKSEDEMLKFQQQHDVAFVDEETKDVIKQLSDMEGNLLAQDMEIKRTDSELANGGDLNSLVALQVRKKSLESGRSLLGHRVEKLRGMLSKAPAVGLQYGRLARNIAMQTKKYELLEEQYQLAAISQHGKDGDYQVVDRARPKSRPVAPRMLLNTILGAMLGFALTATRAIRSAGGTAKLTEPHLEVVPAQEGTSSL